MIIASGRVQRFLLASDILNNLYPGPLTLVTPSDPRSVIVPQDRIVMGYNAGTVAFGANVGIQIGVPDHLDTWSGNNLNVGISQLDSQFARVTPASANANLLTDYINQPLVISFVSAAATYGPIATSTKVSGGADYAVDDEFEFDADTGATGKVLTVAAITGAVLTYSILTPGTVVPPGTNATTATSGIGTGLTISVTPTQGNGSLYVEFAYDVIRIPVLCGTSPIWPIQ